MPNDPVADDLSALAEPCERVIARDHALGTKWAKVTLVPSIVGTEGSQVTYSLRRDRELIATRGAGYMFSTIAFANPLVDVSVAPSIRRSKSYVTRFCAIVFSRLAMMRSATSFHPM
jgi:hypothetical protein